MAPRSSQAKPTSGPQSASSPGASTHDVRSLAAALLQRHGGADAVLSLIDTLANERDALSNERDALMAEHERQKLRIQQLLHLLHGRRTEKLAQEELEQLALALGADEQEAAKPEPDVPHPAAPDAGDDRDSDAEPSPGKPEQGTRKKKRTRRSQTVVGADVERRVRDVPVPEHERSCACCNREMDIIDHVERRWLEFVPGKFIEHVERREKRACRRSDCRGDILGADRPLESPDRRKVDASLLAQLVDAKCNDAQPIDRQRDQFKRMGVSFPLNTLYSYWTYVTTLLMPVAKIALARVLADAIVGVDDTKLRVLDKSRAAGSYKACLWCFTGVGPLVAFTVTESWEAEAIAPHLGVVDGFIQCDDYKGYSSTVDMPDGAQRVLVDPDKRLACMMHVRRRFYSALQLGDKRAVTAIDLIAKLYEIEADAKQRGLDADQRLALRTERSLPVLERFEAWVDQTKPKCTPKSPLAQAIGYAEQQRPFIRRCFSDGRFEIDNGHTERAIRRPCIGRNNYLFTGSIAAAQRLAGAYTLVLSCRNLGVDVRTYLIDVIRKLEDGWPLRRIGELVPDRWAALHGPLAQG